MNDDYWAGRCKVCTGDHPTHWCCKRCNYDEHRCSGCGTDLPHELIVCGACEKR